MPDFLVMIIVGGIAGWLASMVMARDASMGILLNIVVGIVGGLLGGFLFGTVIDTGTAWINYLITAFIGAVILLLIANLVQRRRVR
jgi:uncharacterized membrane protein YeaQ/YmgE (transglycosylase-associated protein family)